MLIEKLVIGIYQSNCYVIGCEKSKKGCVIDPGGNVREIIKIIRENDLTVEYIFNTHHHSDHTDGNRELKKLTDAKILIHKNDAHYIKNMLDEKSDLILTEEVIIKVGNIDFRIYHTPGHTPGGLCFYAEGKLFTGDTLFVGDSGATVYEGGDRKALGASIRRLMKELPGETVIYPGHDYGPMPASTLNWEKRNNVNAKEYGYYE